MAKIRNPTSFLDNLDLKIDQSRRVSAVSTRKMEQENSVYVNKNLDLFEFALNFERMKIFKYYFPHNNSDTIIKKIVFTGGSGSILHQDMKEGKYAEQFLLNLGIPSADILIESESNNTRENAVFTQKLLVLVQYIIVISYLERILLIDGELVH